jgi:SPX domain protein involved in polyphosphate accumulation
MLAIKMTSLSFILSTVEAYFASTTYRKHGGKAITIFLEKCISTKATMEPYQAVFKRKEVKYLLAEAQLFALRPALEAHMEPDDFAHSSIYNLYYDTPDFRLIRRSLEKPAYKEKLRLRSYGVPNEETQVFPEIKKKARGIVYKRRVSMPYGDALRYLSRR